MNMFGFWIIGWTKIFSDVIFDSGKLIWTFFIILLHFLDQNKKTT